MGLNKSSSQLEFDLELISESSMEVSKALKVKDWLYGEGEYRKLQICADGLQTLYFDCKLTPGNDHFYNRGYAAFSCRVQCSSQFAWENVSRRRFKPYVDSSVQTFNNISADNGDLLPIINFTTALGSNAFKIINRSYDNLEFAWTNLQAEETITCDCLNGIISSSTGLKRVKNFNKRFLKLKKGINTLEFVGNVTSLEFSYRNARRLGGGFYE